MRPPPIALCVPALIARFRVRHLLTVTVTVVVNPLSAHHQAIITTISDPVSIRFLSASLSCLSLPALDAVGKADADAPGKGKKEEEGERA